MPENRAEITMQFLSEPTDVNYGGKVHGGVVMKWIDQAAYACATQWCEGYCVTVYVGGIRFFKPIHIGHLVKIKASIIYTGTTSMHIAVDMYSRPVKEKEFSKTTHCIIVFVAVDDNQNPVAVPNFIPENEDEKQREQYALKLMELRKNIGDEMKKFTEI